MHFSVVWHDDVSSFSFGRVYGLVSVMTHKCVGRFWRIFAIVKPPCQSYDKSFFFTFFFNLSLQELWGRCLFDYVTLSKLELVLSFFYELFLIAEVFELHMEELRAKQEEISKRDEEIKLLEAIIQTLGGTESRSRNEWHFCLLNVVCTATVFAL